jgi:endonuclease/exonuclease/phosphatase (EEP) superfamily protein YafD
MPTGHAHDTTQEDETPERAREQRYFHVLVRIAFLAAGLATVLAMLARFHWIADLFAHFQLYYLLILAVLALVFLHKRHYLLLVFAIVLAVPNAWSVGPYLIPLIPGNSVAASTGVQLSIVSLNLNYRSDAYNPVRRYFTVNEPDVVVLTEWTPNWKAGLRFLEARYPYRIERPQIDPWGIAVFSKHPFRDAKIIELGTPDFANIRVTLDLQGTPVDLYATHLAVPVSHEKARLRNLQLKSLAAETAGSVGTTVVTGDMNITPFSPLFNDLLDNGNLRDARRPQGFHYTWPTLPLPLWIPIDHCLTSPDIVPISVATGPNLGSDHYPLEILVEIPTPAKAGSR